MPTSFASHAFHPVDGFLQSVPYHLYPFLFPLNKYLYLVGAWGAWVAVGGWLVGGAVAGGRCWMRVLTG